jgi:hypothetical protein
MIAQALAHVLLLLRVSRHGLRHGSLHAMARAMARARRHGTYLV